MWRSVEWWAALAGRNPNVILLAISLINVILVITIFQSVMLYDTRVGENIRRMTPISKSDWPHFVKRLSRWAASKLLLCRTVGDGSISPNQFESCEAILMVMVQENIIIRNICSNRVVSQISRQSIYQGNIPTRTLIRPLQSNAASLKAAQLSDISFRWVLFHKLEIKSDTKSTEGTANEFQAAQSTSRIPVAAPWMNMVHQETIRTPAYPRNGVLISFHCRSGWVCDRSFPLISQYSRQHQKLRLNSISSHCLPLISSLRIRDRVGTPNSSECNFILKMAPRVSDHPSVWFFTFSKMFFFSGPGSAVIAWVVNLIRRSVFKPTLYRTYWIYSKFKSIEEETKFRNKIESEIRSHSTNFPEYV